MQKLALQNLPVAGKKVLMRVDFNVPFNAEGQISDDTRIKAAIPSIQYVLDHGGAVILMSHLGRPKGAPDPHYSLAPCAKRLAELLKRPVQFAPDCVGTVAETMAKALKPGQVLLLENVRFHRGEEKPADDPTFVKQLARLGDLYVNDAFGTAHRAHASTTLLAQLFPGKAAAGFLMQKEIRYLQELLQHPKRPFYALIGGAKISTKIGVLKALLQQSDTLLIGGAMAYTFLKAQGVAIGNSLYEADQLTEARSVLEESDRLGKRLLLPQDHVIAKEGAEEAPTRIVSSIQGIPDGWQGVDIGPRTVQQYVEILKGAATIFWNGPMGIFEVPPFAAGTFTIARALADSSAVTVIGGGESVAAVEAAGVANRITHLSTGGGASLEYIEFGKLPGIEALSNVN